MHALPPLHRARRAVFATAAATALSAVTAFGALPASAATKASGLDREWLKTSIEGDHFEIASGNLALQQSQDPQVRQLAQTLVTDHTRSLDSATKLAKSVGADV